MIISFDRTLAERSGSSSTFLISGSVAGSISDESVMISCVLEVV